MSAKSRIFIPQKEPLAVGTQLRFEFQLQDGNALLSNEARWSGTAPADPAEQRGAGRRCALLIGFPDSQKVLERILSEKARGPTATWVALRRRFPLSRDGPAFPIQSADPKGRQRQLRRRADRAIPADPGIKLAAAIREGRYRPNALARIDRRVPARSQPTAGNVKQMTR